MSKNRGTKAPAPAPGPAPQFELDLKSGALFARTASGRVEVKAVAAVLEKHLGLHLAEHDIYVNVAGGIRIAEVGVELPLALALHSARTGAPLPVGLAVIGEVSLTGEVRPVPGLEKRQRACRDLGFTSLIGPAAAAPGTAATPADAEKVESISFTGVASAKEAVRAAFARSPKSDGPDHTP